jgi:hypothetical protein
MFSLTKGYIDAAAVSLAGNSSVATMLEISRPSSIEALTAGLSGKLSTNFWHATAMSAVAVPSCVFVESTWAISKRFNDVPALAITVIIRAVSGPEMVGVV